ncbi:MAG: ABC-2 transporter permease [Lachnospiraceae bacterium]|nr:ABC-2 transporter permease [Lachnospiraceae bacterium]
MKGLLVKDICLLLQQKKFLILLLVLSIVLNFNSDGSFVIGYLTFVCSFFVISSITYDEYENGYRFLFTLPVGRNSYVQAKYAFAVLLCTLAWLTGCLISTAFYLANNQAAKVQAGMGEACILLPLILIFLAVMLPVQFKFGSEKGRIVMAFTFCGCILIGYLLQKIGEQASVQLGQIMQMVNRLLKLDWWLQAGIFGIVTLLVLGISYMVSVAVMRGKEF